MLTSSKGECESNNNCSKGLSLFKLPSRLLLFRAGDLFFFFPPLTSSPWIFCVSKFALLGFVTVGVELSVQKKKKSFLCLCLYRTRRNLFESSTGVLVFPELRYSRVCFIMVLGALRPDISHPGENLHSATIYQSPGWRRKPEWHTQAGLCHYAPPSYSKSTLNWWCVGFSLNVLSDHTQALVVLQMLFLLWLLEEMFC